MILKQSGSELAGMGWYQDMSRYDGPLVLCLIVAWNLFYLAYAVKFKEHFHGSFAGFVI